MSYQRVTQYLPNNKIKKVLMLMRHSEKVIKTGKKPKCGKYDSELTQHGIEQSFICGKKFISQLKKYNISKISPSEILIISSPYMRTLQTTTHFLRGIDSQNFFEKNDMNKLYNISIEYGVREILNKNKYKEDIPKNYLNFLYNSNFADFDQELKKLKFNILKNYEFSTEKESKDECYIRCKKYVDEVLVNYGKNDEYKVIVIIAHGGPIKYIMKALGYNIELFHGQKVMFSDQYYFDISKGIMNAEYIEKISSY